MRAVILEAIAALALKRVTDEMPIEELGLDSLELVQLEMEVGERLGREAAAKLKKNISIIDLAQVETVGDLVRVYEEALEKKGE